MCESADRIIAYRGGRFTIEYARESNRDVPGLDFFKSLEPRWQARFVNLYKRLGDFGQIQNREMFRKESEGFWAFKAFQARLLCYFRPDQRVVITHGFSKKGDAIRRQEFERAARIKQEYEEFLAGFRLRK